MIHGKVIQKPGIAEIAKASWGFAVGPQEGGLTHEPATSRANVLVHVWLWPIAIKPIPS